MLTGRSGQRLEGDRGSTLMLMPAAVLIVIILGAIAADFSHVHNRKRELIAVANSIANDAATYGINVNVLRDPTGASTIAYDPDRIRDVVNQSVSKHVSPDRPIGLVGYRVDEARNTVTVELSDNVDWIFAKAMPGVDDSHLITATGTATAEED